MTLPTLSDIAAGGKRALSQALAAIETHAGEPALAALLDEACRAARGHVLGLTGPPGVGKSTLTNTLIKHWRGSGETVGVIAVDPSSKRTGGALLGDRARIVTDPEDKGIFVRSMAARDRLGGLSDQTVAAMVMMRAIYDRVLIESVGIGQSETDIAFAVDTVVLCIQPGSGDSLQFMKAGAMEVPDIVAVTKADMGAPAQRAANDVKGALTLYTGHEDWPVPVVLVAAGRGDGLGELTEAIERHRAHLAVGGRLAQRRGAQEAAWVEEGIRAHFGAAGLKAASAIDAGTAGPFGRELAIARVLASRLEGGKTG
ncbi:ArgK/MeaB family GTPase [Blastochloris sulfoviridis]|uniref:Methylmalonyl Co-A mutase-associated GTPase MeaB n=1 Tax=Blastochloris sulfoviridis TaxID=50712 RepID=A0A5M6HWG7_9HYPH|nr:ATP/GTP-binding protein [Blastochloris sulfoviridis]KAA5599889.1 methylmalonyl Co-A mutase-associated GTPase MeaB [Blastochloris sulfoviridis]